MHQVPPTEYDQSRYKQRHQQIHAQNEILRKVNFTDPPSMSQCMLLTTKINTKAGSNEQNKRVYNTKSVYAKQTTQHCKKANNRLTLHILNSLMT